MEEPTTETTATETMTAGEALAEILDVVRSTETKLDDIIDTVNKAAEQLEEVVAQGVGGLLGNIFGGGNGDSEHPQDPG